MEVEERSLFKIFREGYAEEREKGLAAPGAVGGEMVLALGNVPWDCPNVIEIHGAF